MVEYGISYPCPPGWSFCAGLLSVERKWWAREAREGEASDSRRAYISDTCGLYTCILVNLEVGQVI